MVVTISRLPKGCDMSAFLEGLHVGERPFSGFFATGRALKAFLRLAHDDVGEKGAANSALQRIGLADRREGALGARSADCPN